MPLGSMAEGWRSGLFSQALGGPLRPFFVAVWWCCWNPAEEREGSILDVRYFRAV